MCDYHNLWVKIIAERNLAIKVAKLSREINTHAFWNSYLDQKMMKSAMPLFRRSPLGLLFVGLNKNKHFKQRQSWSLTKQHLSSKEPDSQLDPNLLFVSAYVSQNHLENLRFFNLDKTNESIKSTSMNLIRSIK